MNSKQRRKWWASIPVGDVMCWYCGKAAHQVNRLTVDHFEPTDRGGLDSASNFVVSCERCNLTKANSPPRDWMNRLRRKLTPKYGHRPRMDLLQPIFDDYLLRRRERINARRSL